MKNTKLTLSVDEDVIREGKIYASKNGTTLSKEFEELIISLTKRDIMDDIIKALGLKKGYISSEDVVKQRKALKKGFDSAKVIREMRDAREKRILGY